MFDPCSLGQEGVQVPVPVVLQDAPRHDSPPLSCRVGKRGGRGQVAPGKPPLISSISASREGALSVFCRRLGRDFLVDSGADVSVFPASAAHKRGPVTAVLNAANGSSIKTFGKKDIALDLPGLSVNHKFMLADFPSPILGSDFFRRHNLLIDVARQCLYRGSGPSPTSPVVVRARPALLSGGLCGLKQATSVDEVFAAFPSVTAASPSYDSSVPAKHGAVSYTHLTLPTIYSV